MTVKDSVSHELDGLPGTGPWGLRVPILSGFREGWRLSVT